MEVRMFYRTSYLCFLGEYTLVADGENLVGIWLTGQKHFMAAIEGDVAKKPDLPVFARTKGWLNAYFAGREPAISDLPLQPSGGEFRLAVWNILCEIPYGQYTTYGEVAKRIASQTGKKSMSAQAVGGAIGRNPISIIIPCHRVLGAKGNLTGYAGGVDIKMKLLKHEGIDVSGFFHGKESRSLTHSIIESCI